MPRRGPSYAPRLWPVTGRILLAVASTLLTLGAAELAFRWTEHPGRRLSSVEYFSWLGPSADPTPSTVVGGVRFWEEPISPAILSGGTTRILLLGDSFTYGAGIENSRDRFSDLLEAGLESGRERPGSPRFHVFNAAVGSTEPVRSRTSRLRSRPSRTGPGFPSSR